MTYARISNGKVISVKDGNQPYIYVGTDAGKPTPGVGDFAICSDTGKEYRCYVNGIWSLTSSPTYEFYSNHNGTVDNSISTAVVGLGTASTDAPNHELDMATGAGSGTSTYIGTKAIDLDTMNIEFNCVIDNLVSGVTDNRSTTIGITDLAGIGAFIFYLSSTNLWTCETSNGVDSTTTNITALADGDIITIRSMNDVQQFLINGAIVATHTDIMAGLTTFPCAQVAADAGCTVSRSMSIDYISWKVMI